MECEIHDLPDIIILQFRRQGKLKICPNITSREILKNQETFNYQLDFENNFQSNVERKRAFM